MSHVDFRARSVWTRLDPFAPAVGVVAFVVYALHGFSGGLIRDIGIYSYAGQQVLNGVPPYEGVLNRAGPLAHLLPALGVLAARVTGIDELLAMRFLFLLFSVTCVCLVYILARQMFASRRAGLAAAAAFLSFNGFIEYASYGPREKTPMVLFLLLTLFALSKQRWLSAGVCISLATLTWQPAFFVGMAAAVVVLIARPHDQAVRGLARLIVGGLVPAAICVGYFAVVGAVSTFLNGFVLINAEYTVPGPLSSHFAHKWESLNYGYGVSLWVILIGLVSSVFVALSAIVRDYKLREPRAALTVAVGVAGIAGFCWCFRDFDLWPDAFVVLPPAALGIGGLMSALIERLTPERGIAFVIAWVVVGVAIATSYSVGERDHSLVGQRRSVKAVLEPLPADASILSIQAPQPLMLAGKTNPSPYQMFPPGLINYMNDTYPGGIKGYGAWIGREQPTLIAIGGVPNRRPPWLAETLKKQYKRVGHAPGWTWYADRSLGRNMIRKLRDATGRPASG